MMVITGLSAAPTVCQALGDHSMLLISNIYINNSLGWELLFSLCSSENRGWELGVGGVSLAYLDTARK